uniref:Osteopetrosis-associated transmembrane protein 1 n=1 Tax=Glossina morsitans morsitans TaxID=37546 RepID=A0A1B0FJS1_GLOMM
MFQRLILKLYLILQAYAFATKLDTEPSCPKLLAELGDFQKNLVTCVTHNSVPVQICSNCKIVYGNMTKQYQRLSNCSEYFDQDRLNLIPTTQNLLSSIWSKAYCNECDQDDALQKYTDKNEELSTCINKTANNEVCATCLHLYRDLNSYFTSLNQRYNGKVCFEMQDQMNRTRNHWSKGLKCCQRKPKLTYFTIALAFVISLPMIFYTSSYIITIQRENNHGTLHDEDPLLNVPGPTASTSSTATPGATSLPTTSSTNLNETTSAISKKIF